MLNLKLMQRLDTAENDIATLKNKYEDLEARVSSNEEKINQSDDAILDVDSQVTKDGEDITALDLSAQKMSNVMTDLRKTSSFKNLK